MSIFTVDVWFSRDRKDAEGRIIRDAAWAHGEEWTRCHVEAQNGTEAELIACQMIPWSVVRSAVWI